MVHAAEHILFSIDLQHQQLQMVSVESSQQHTSYGSTA